MTATYINEALRLLRKSKDMELSEVAQKLDVSPSYVSRIENGQKNPNLDLLEKYSHVFDVDTSFIMYFAEKLEKDKSLTGNFTKSILRMMNLMESWGKIE